MAVVSLTCSCLFLYFDGLMTVFFGHRWRLIHLRPRLCTAMTQVRYGVGGEPVTHSLSPMLMALVAEHLHENRSDLNAKIRLETNLERVEVIPATRVEDALAWGYVGSLPGEVPNWEYTGSPISAFRARTIIERVAKKTTAEITTAHESLQPLGEAILPVRNKRIPGSPEERWLSLTSPLKHQLSSAAMKFVDAGKEIDSVNALRWNTREWWVASTDGIGLVHVAQHRGIEIENGAILCLHGGGGAARSCAEAWAKAGGKLLWSGGRRELAEDGPWASALLLPGVAVRVAAGTRSGDRAGAAADAGVEEVAEIAVSINFDLFADHDSEYVGAGLQMRPSYTKTSGTYEERIIRLNAEQLDGRWLLCAQHLGAWSTLWCPGRAEDLPSLELLLDRLVFAESLLAEY